MANDAKTCAKRVLALVDLTDLNDNCDVAAIDQLCARATTAFGHVAAICIWPRFVAHAKPLLKGSGVRIATVVNFPSGNQSTEDVVRDTKTALADGADEIDLVMDYASFKAGQADAALAQMRTVRKACKGALLKIILETGELGDAETIRSAAELAISAGADFIKTSTGKVSTNATPQAAIIMLEAIKASGKAIGFKPAGGIRTLEDAEMYLDIADRIMGAGWATPKTFRFGASGLLDALLATAADTSPPPHQGAY